jgi:hypothetical protein
MLQGQDLDCGLETRRIVLPGRVPSNEENGVFGPTEDKSSTVHPRGNDMVEKPVTESTLEDTGCMIQFFNCARHRADFFLSEHPKALGRGELCRAHPLK